MSCYHRYGHGCGPLPPYEFYEDYGYRPRRYRDEVVVLDDYDDDERPRRRRESSRGRRRRYETVAETTAPISLQDRAAALRAELAQIQDELDALSDEAVPTPVE